MAPPSFGCRCITAVIDQAEVEVAIDHWREHTCLTFQEVPDDFSGHHLVFNDAQFCASYVGRIPSFSNGQAVWLHYSCVDEVKHFKYPLNNNCKLTPTLSSSICVMVTECDQFF